MSRFFGFLGASKIREAPSDEHVRPYQRLRLLRTCWHAIQRNSTLIDKARRQDLLVPEIEKLGRLLIDECVRADRSAPRACLEYTLGKGIFSWLVTVASGGPNGLTRCIISTFMEIIEIQDDDFLTQEVICKSLSSLFRYLTQRTRKDDMTDQMVRLLFSICSKIHHYPPLLAMFFDHVGWLERVGPLSGKASSSYTDAGIPVRYEDEFLLFYLLMDNMHQPGSSGDFCRTGLLYIIESANNNTLLQCWIADSELPTFLTVGLGSHYSALGSKLRIEYGADQDLLLASSSEHVDRNPQLSMGLELVKSSSDPAFLASLGRYLTYLAYWQDILTICGQHELHDSLMDAYRILFLRNILYPSLIESSDVDGGSAVAVSIYLASSLEIMVEPDLVDHTLGYLFAAESKGVEASQAGKRAKPLLEKIASTVLDPVLFTLKDMIFHNLQSCSMDTKMATLRLLDSLIRNHIQSVDHILLKATFESENRNPSIGHHNKEMQTLASLLGDTAHESSSSQDYQNYLQDAVAYCKISVPQLEVVLHRDENDVAPSTVLNTSNSSAKLPRDAVAPDDPLLNEIINMLSNFLVNNVELNLMLSKVVVDLAAAQTIALEGWLLFHRTDSWIGSPGEIAPDYSVRLQQHAEHYSGMIPELVETKLSDDDDDDHSLDFGRECASQAVRNSTLPTWSNFPRFLILFKTLAAQIRQYKSENDTLESDIEKRRQAFELAEEQKDPAVMIAEAQAPLFMDATDDVSTHTRSKRTSSKSEVAHATPSKIGPTSLFSKHFSSTKREVPALHSVSFRTESMPDFNIAETPIKSRKSGPSVAGDSSSPTRSSIRSMKTIVEAEVPSNVSVSRLVNNIIVFEEFIKELMAVIQVRRTLSGGCEFV